MADSRVRLVARVRARGCALFASPTAATAAGRAMPTRPPLLRAAAAMLRAITADSALAAMPTAVDRVTPSDGINTSPASTAPAAAPAVLVA